MSRLVIGSRAELIAALRKQVAERGGAGANAAAAALAEEARALAEELFLDALFLVAQFPGGQITEAEKCCYAYDVRECAGLCRATWTEEAFWSGLVRVRAGPAKRTRLMSAAWHGDAARVSWLLARGAPWEAIDVIANTALHWASARGRADAARALLAAGALVDAAGGGGCTALWVATQYGCAETVRVLLSAGANVEACVTAGFTGYRPLHIASICGHVAAATLLLDAGADVNALDNDGDSPLFYARTPAMRALLAARGGV